MAGHDRKLRIWQFAVDHVQVGSADPAGRDLDQNFAGRRLWADRSRMTSGVRGLSSTMARMPYLPSRERNRSHEYDGFEVRKERTSNAHGNFKSKTTSG